MDLNKLYQILLDDNPGEKILENEEYIFSIIPELRLSKDFDQKNSWHIYDVYNHILKVVDNVDNNLILRLTALFHDIGKPYVSFETEEGIRHFYNHNIKSQEIFDSFAEKYNIDIKIKNIVSKLILYHDMKIYKLDDEKIKKIFTTGEIIMLYKIKRSDLLAQNPKYHYLMEEYNNQEKYVLNIIKNGGMNNEKVY